MNTIVGRHLVPATRGYAGVSPAALMAHFILATGLAGYVSDERQGDQPRRGSPRAPDRRERGQPLGRHAGTAKIWGASLAAGRRPRDWYGDFLFGELNRNGQDFDWGSLGGPLLSDSEQVAKVVRQAISGGAVNSTTGRSQIPGELVKIGSSNIPLVNPWYTRLALDYLRSLWQGCEEAVSPGYLQRYESRVKNQEHSAFLLNPTSALN